MSQTQERSFDPDSAAIESSCIWAKTLMNQPIGNVSVIVPNHMDTATAIQYFLSEKHDNADPLFEGDNTNPFAGDENEKTFEKDDEKQSMAVVPAENVRRTDVLLGRGRSLWLRKHPGNLMLRELIANYYGTYNSCKKSDKTKLSKTIVSAVVGQQGRFLKQEKVDGGNVILWKCIDTIQAERKVAYTFRGIRKQQKRNQTTKHSQSLHIHCRPISKTESMSERTIVSM